MRILVIGGGIGGLALGAGLRRSGFDVQVFERDTDPAVTAGYHITLHGPVQAALDRLLEPAGYEQILASAADGRKRDPDVFWDWRGRLFWRAKPLADPGIDIDRVTLRVLLAQAAGDTLRLGRTFVGYAVGDEAVTARFADGSSLDCDLLVGADGAHSLVVKQLVGRSVNQPTGVVGVSGRTPVSALGRDTADRLGTRSSLAMGPRGLALYVGYLDPVGHAALDRPDLRQSVTAEPTYIWGAMFPESDYSRALRGMGGGELKAETLRHFRQRGWADRMLEVVDRSLTEDIAVYRFNAAPSDTSDLAPWSPGRVTALGDAVHATPPTAGMGAGIAIRDADDLVDSLVAVRRGDHALRRALGEYEARMRVRGSEAIAAALAVIRWLEWTDTTVGSNATRLLLPAMAAGQWLLGKR